MRFLVKVDEDLPRAAGEVLREHGHDTASVIDQGMGGAKDPALWKPVQEESRYLITADKGFADVRTHPTGTHTGLSLLRSNEDGLRPVVHLLSKVLRFHTLDDLAGGITAAPPQRRAASAQEEPRTNIALHYMRPSIVNRGNYGVT